jgi:hypothetical protein
MVHAGIDLALAGVDARKQEPRAWRGSGEIAGQGIERRQQDQRQRRGKRQALGDGEPHAQAGEAARSGAARDGAKIADAHAALTQDLVAQGEQVGGMARGGFFAQPRHSPAGEMSATRAVGVEVSKASRGAGETIGSIIAVGRSGRRRS